MTATYQAIATTTLSSAQSDITFTSIPSTFTDIVAVVTAKTSAGTAQLLFQLNGDTGSNYSITRTGGDGSATGSERASNTAFGQLSWWGYIQNNNNQVVIAHFMNYSNNTTYKTVLSRPNNAAVGVGMNVCLWRSTSAVTSIKLYPDASTFAAGTVATIYGIKAE